MSDPTVSERRIRPIKDAVEGGNWKQALKECDKWHKKGEKSDRFLALKAYVLVKQPDIAQHEKGKAEVEQLCKRNPAITDVEALHQIQDALQDLSLDSAEGPKPWERAVAASPNDKELLMTWLNLSIAGSNWLSAQKAAMALRKAFPKDRKYDFWNIVMCYLVHGDKSLAEKDRMLFGTLAYRLISKAAENVPTDKDQILGAGKAIYTVEELLLLVRIYLSTGRSPEAVKLLQSESLGLESRFAEQNPQLVLSLLLEAFESAQMWDEAFDFCETQLSSETAADDADPHLWAVLQTAAKNSKKSPELSKRIEKLLEKHKAKHPNDRVALQVGLSLYTNEIGHGFDKSSLLVMCQEYCKKYRGKAFCFEDLREPLGRLKPNERDTFFTTLSEQNASSDTQDLLLDLKTRYCFRVAIAAESAPLDHFAREALHLYESSLKKSRQCPDAGLLAALAIMKSSQSYAPTQEIHWERLLQVAMLLETCRVDSEEYYPYLILLVRIQQILGMMSLAMTNWKRLNVKNVQCESLSYFLLNRISTLHPRQFGKASPTHDTAFSPLQALDEALHMLEKSQDTSTHQIREGLKYGSYANIIEAVEMRANLRNSINGEIFAYEHLRIRRMTGLFDDGGIPIRISKLIDQRDLSFLQSFEFSGETPLDSLQLGPLPKENWLDAIGIYDKMFHLLKDELQGPRGPSEKAIGLLKDALLRLRMASDSISSELTEIEIENLTVHKHLAEAILLTKEGSSSDQTTLDQNLEFIEKWLQGVATDRYKEWHRIRGIALPDWIFLHSSFSALETLQIISLFLTVVSRKSKSVKSKAPAIVKDAISTLQQQVHRAEEAIHRKAWLLKDGLNTAGVLGKLMDVGLGRSDNADEQSAVGKELEKLADAARLETFCGEMKESWEEALDGVLATRVKVFK